jgi:metal-responsive CopG/Arc/MetJ family transcriptional regulator
MAVDCTQQTNTGEPMARKRLHVFLDSELMSKVADKAKKERRTKTEVVRQALLRYILQIDTGESN